MQTSFTKLKTEQGEFNIAYHMRDSGGDWILCMHGLQSSKQLFELVFEDSRFSKFSLLAVDYLGFGDSDKPEESSYQLEHQTALVEELLISLGIERCHIIGHSLGGMIGTLLLNSKKVEILSLASLEGNLILDDCGTSRDIANFTEEQFRDEGYPALKKELSNSSHPSIPLRIESLEHIPHYVFLRTAKDILKESESGRLLELFEGATVPRLLVLGLNGTFIARPDAEGITTVAIPNSGHFMLLDNPEATLDALSDFLKREAAPETFN